MAARRVVILMLAVLGVATLAAALVPSEPRRSSDSRAKDPKSDKPSGSKADRSQSGRLVQATIDADRAHPPTIALREGDELKLEVGSPRSDQVEIPAFGLIDDTSTDAPARFDILTDREGVFKVRLVESGRTVGRLDVR